MCQSNPRFNFFFIKYCNEIVLKYPVLLHNRKFDLILPTYLEVEFLLEHSASYSCLNLICFSNSKGLCVWGNLKAQQW